tara:strand:- start:146 stop:565 length:420 start_codon:yes stop_codon:yes gene_type:complete
MYVLEHIHEINNFYSKLLRTAASKFNLTFEQAKLLFSIPYDGVVLSDLAEILGIDNSTLTRNIGKLINNNFLNISFDQYDKRKKILLLTDKSTDIIKEIEKQMSIIFEKINNFIEIDDIEKIHKSLEKLNWSLNCIDNE